MNNYVLLVYAPKSRNIFYIDYFQKIIVLKIVSGILLHEVIKLRPDHETNHGIYLKWKEIKVKKYFVKLELSL